MVLAKSLPNVIGYVASLDGLTPIIATGLMLISGRLAAVLMSVGALFLRGFPITRQRHAVVQEMRRRASRSGS